MEEYLGGLFMSEGKMKQEIDRRIGVVFPVMRALRWSIVAKRELSQKAKLSVYRLTSPMVKKIAGTGG